MPSRLTRSTAVLSLLLLIAMGLWLTFDGLSGGARSYLITDSRLVVDQSTLSQGPLRLRGTVRLYPGVFVDPTVPENKRPPSVPVTIPGTQEAVTGASQGYGTLAFTILMPDGAGSSLGFRSQSLSSAAEVFIDGVSQGLQGLPGKDAHTERALIYPLDASFAYRPGGSEILIHFSNYHDLEPILKGFFVGTDRQIRLLTMKATARDLFILGGLFVMAFKYLHFFFSRPAEKEYLYFSLLCIAIGTRTLMVGQRFLLQLYPAISWEVFSRTVLVAFYLAGWAYLAFIRQLFPGRFNRRLYQIMTVAASASVVLTLILPGGLLETLILPYELLVAVMMIYCAVQSVRHYWLSPGIYRPIIVSLAVVTVCALNDILNSYSLVDTDTYSAVGVFFMVLMHSFVLSYRYADAANRSEVLLTELKTVNETLERRVDERTQELDTANAELLQVNEALSETNRRLAALAMEDPLTGIPNRRAYSATLAEWVEFDRSDSAFIAVCMLDIDHFKGFNDRYGHDSGDQCLIRIAAQLRSAAEARGGMAARLGGEEFALVVPVAAPQDADALASELLEAVRRLDIRHEASPIAPHVTVSAGIFVETLPSSKPSRELLNRADGLMYQAKNNGRNCWVLATGV